MASIKNVPKEHIALHGATHTLCKRMIHVPLFINRVADAKDNPRSLSYGLCRRCERAQMKARKEDLQ